MRALQSHTSAVEKVRRKAAAASRRDDSGRPRSPALVLLVLALLIGAAALVSLNLGFIRLAPLDVLRTLAGAGTDQQELILFEFRLPRIVLAMLVGVGLAVSGAVLQGVSRNDLTDPGIIGINAGAGLAVVATLGVYSSLADGPFFDPDATPVGIIPLSAFVGALGSAALVYALAYKRGGITPSRLLLVGVAVSTGLSALMLVLALRMDTLLYRYAVAWLTGTIANTTWNSVLVILPWVAALTPLAIARSQVLNILNLGDGVAIGVGVTVERQRRLLLATAVGLAAACVALAGGIAFVGLIGPHLARRLVGPNHRVLLPASAMVGALLLVVADMIARNLLAPVELPVGVVVAIVGAPYFLYLLARTTG